MVKALVLYNSLFGNTKIVAEQIALGLQEENVLTDCVNIKEIDRNSLNNYDFIAVGGPTHNISLSKDMKEFFRTTLYHLKLKGKKGFAFDTRKESKMNSKRYFILENSAARRIQVKLKKMKLKIIKDRESALIEPDRKGPLLPGVKERFFQIGKELGQLLQV